MGDNANELRKKLAEVLDNLVLNSDMMEGTMRELARMMFFLFDQYVKAGFTPEQALKIILHRGLT